MERASDAVAPSHTDLEAALARTARTDALTGLANRGALGALLDGLAASDASATILFTSPEDLRLVNQRHGYPVGDVVLRATADRLLACCPPPAVGARVSGDEFVVVLPGHSADHARSVATWLADALSAEVVVEGAVVALTHRIGVAPATASPDTRHGLLEAARCHELARAHGVPVVVAGEDEDPGALVGAPV